MKVLVLGWMRLRGIGKDSKKPYDFARLHVANPITEKAGEQMSRTGDGLEQAHIDLQAGSEGQFRGLKYPCVLELKLDHVLGPTGRMDVVCVGYNAALKATA
jgi:hypothetical protein